MKRLVTVCFAVVLVVSLSAVGSSGADLTPEQTKVAEALIKQFSAREFAVRQKAVEELIKMGPDVLPLVKKTLAETKDAEVKLRCRMVIKGVEQRHPTPPRRLSERLLDLGVDWRGGGGRPEVVSTNVSPDGKSVANVLKRNKKWLVVHGGKEGPEYDMISVTPRFSPDSRRMVYGAKREGKRFMVLDGKEGPVYETVVFFVFSPDSKRLAFLARRDGQVIMVCDGREIPYRMIREQKFSPDSRHFAYAAGSEAGMFVVADGVAGPPHDDVFGLHPGARLRYVGVIKGEAWAYEADWPPAEMLAGQTLRVKRVKSLGKVPTEGGRAIWASPTGDGVASYAKRDGKTAFSLNGRELGVYDEGNYPGLVFSPDGRHVAYGVRLGGQWLMLLDGKELARYDGFRANVKPTRPGTFYPYAKQGVSMQTFSPDGKHLAYCVNHARGGFIVCNGRKGPEYGRVAYPRFSPDGRHLCYWAERGRRKWLVVCDGIETGADRKISGPHERWVVTPTGFRYRFFDKGHNWQAQVDWPADLDWTNGLKPPKP